ncbi:vasoactive intestinal polypeptide receptor isoform X2 [Brachyhypopomus gauderio]|uniref:vasoactive intestinal polypeptide receptor isoform X2 n=1 Tax=Brachyhypopomus gauderio TaxID=698409 RepID=UPI00404340FE
MPKSGFVFCLTCLLGPMLSIQMCDIMKDLETEKDECLAHLENITSDCDGEWDLACWPSASAGQLVIIPCPNYFSHVTDQKGNISKACTQDGWTEIDPSVVAQNCGYSLNFTEGEDMGQFLGSVRIGYTIGHTVSLMSLIIAIFILCFFRKLHCTRNYIHIHLFLAFTLKAISVIMKDVVLYGVAESDECDPGSVGCKAAMVFFQYGVMASFFWLLVEGLFLHALLAISFFSHRKYFWWYILIGWGVPAVFITAWSISKAYVNNVGCWEMIDDLWWIINTPILVIIVMNFILFICIIRILRQKINCRDIGRSESHQYSRLAKSTLLLIPLFGINYIVFAFIPHHIQSYMRLVFDVLLGSFQGFCVAVLYCFLNGEVQSEIKRKWRRWNMQRFLDTDTRYQQPSLVSNGNATQITMLTKCSPGTHRPSGCPDNFSTI